MYYLVVDLYTFIIIESTLKTGETLKITISIVPLDFTSFIMGKKRGWKSFCFLLTKEIFWWMRSDNTLLRFIYKGC